MPLKLSPASFLRNFTPPEFVKMPFLLSYICLLSSYLLVLVFYFRLPPVIPLFYSLSQADQQLATKEWIFLFPAILTLVVLGHVTLVHSFRDYEPLLLQLFSWTTLAMCVLVLAAGIRIMVIVS